MSLRFGFGTNGLGDNRLPDALRLLADLGYDGVALTLDTGHLDPYAEDFERDLPRIAALLDKLDLAVVIETGARYLLDPRRKHHPTLISEGSEQRIGFLERAVRIGAELGAEAVSFWSGNRPADEAVPDDELWGRLVRGVERVITVAELHGVRLGFEPEPGMLVEDIAGYERLIAALGDPGALGLTLDLGHCRCLEELSVPDCVRRAGDRLVNVQIEDMRRGVHEHLEFGRGEIDFPPVLAALAEVGYRGLVSVELPRHSHDGPGVAMRSIEFLRAAAPGSEPDLRDLVAGYAKPGGTDWLDQQVAEIALDQAVIRRVFPLVGLRCGRTPAGDSGLCVDDAARIVLLEALGLHGPELTAELTDLYRYGDAAERRAVLHALSHLADLDDSAVPLVLDAVRSNDTRLISAALGRYAAAHLDDDAYRQAVLKCVFTGIPLADVAGLAERTDAELRRMFEHYAAERLAAGRTVPDDVVTLLEGPA
ncbi:MAG TPA: EboA domain-containing protein [Actinospica sp.]|jgi:sugar phosphate isomerase/epimerase|nr:EboA domain-containing protein [Actinospica sp.]